MIAALFTVLVLLVAGYVMQRLQRMPENTADVLNRFIIDVCLPATILRLVPTLDFDPSLVLLVVTPWTMAALAYVLALLAARAMGLDARTQTMLFLVTALGNTSFLGFPLIGALLGDEAVSLAAVYDQLGTFLLLTIVAPLALGRLTEEKRARPLQVVRGVVLFPPFVALLVALLPLPIPSFLDPLLAAAAAPLVPLAMFSVGFKLRLTPPRPRSLFAVGLALKLMVLPAASLGLARLWGAPPLVVNVVVLETAMPTMITAGAVLMAYGIASELVAAFVGWGLLCSLVTVPLWALVLR